MALQMTRIKPDPAGNDRNRYRKTATDVTLDCTSLAAETDGL
jgi:hypothetical protein